jgi:hypothetical protein
MVIRRHGEPQGLPAHGFFGRVLKLAEPHLSDEHFTVDGTLIDAWASQKSFRRKDGSDDGDGANFHGTQRKNDTHQSTTDPDAKLYRKSRDAESKLSCVGHTLGHHRDFGAPVRCQPLWNPILWTGSIVG